MAQLKLSRFNVASLADLEEQSYGLFSITGGKALRELGQKLKSLLVFRMSHCLTTCRLS